MPKKKKKKKRKKKKKKIDHFDLIEIPNKLSEVLNAIQDTVWIVNPTGNETFTKTMPNLWKPKGLNLPPSERSITAPAPGCKKSAKARKEVDGIPEEDVL